MTTTDVSSREQVANVYWRATASQVRRAMTLQDANSASKTFGCCDRSFWQYRTISSFAAATMQQLALPFAVLFSTPFAGSEWHGSAEMLQRARSAMLFWCKLQHHCGAVDEWYRHEHSYCATAFTTYGISEAFLRLENHLAPSDRDSIRSALIRAADWLADRFNDRVMNQNLAACAALWNTQQVTGSQRYKAAAERVWRRTVDHQDEEGWFAEYGGADLGYSLLALDLLAVLTRRGHTDAPAAASRLCRFVASFVTGCGDLAGRLGSRGTEHGFPFGAEAFAESNHDARRIAAHLRASLAADATPGPSTVDDRYLAYFYLPSFVLASTCKLNDIATDCESTEVEWPRSGFRTWHRGRAHVVCSIRRRAAFTIYTPSQIHRNQGYWVEANDGRRFATCAWDSSGDAVEMGGKDDVTAGGSFAAVDDALPLINHETAFRAVSSWVFRWCSAAELFHRLLTERKVVRRVDLPLKFVRTLHWDGDGVIITDVITRLNQTLRFRAVTPTADVEVHSPSAHLTSSSRTECVSVPQDTARQWASEINRSGQLTLITEYRTVGGVLLYQGIRMQGARPSIESAARRA